MLWRTCCVPLGVVMPPTLDMRQLFAVIVGVWAEIGSVEFVMVDFDWIIQAGWALIRLWFKSIVSFSFITWASSEPIFDSKDDNFSFSRSKHLLIVFSYRRSV